MHESRVEEREGDKIIFFLIWQRRTIKRAKGE